MVDRRTRPISKINRKYTFIILAVLSGVIGAIWVAIDTYTGYAIIPNEYVFAIQTMGIGYFVSVLFVLILWIPISSKPFEKKPKELNISNLPPSLLDNTPPKKERRQFSFLGQLLDPQFHGIRLPTKKMVLWLFLSGLFSGINTVIYFLLINSMPLSVFLPASQFVVVYLIIGDLITEKNMPCAVEIQSIIMIVLGVVLAALEIDASSFNIQGLLLIFFVFNTTAAIYVVFQKKVSSTKDRKGDTLDSTNIRFWTLLFMTIFTIVFSLPFMKKDDWIIFGETFFPGFLPITISMLLVFVSRILYVRALTMGKMSIVNSLSSVSVIIGIPITIFCNIFWPEYFPIPTGPSAWIAWLLRGIGIILVFTGIVGLSMSEVKIVILAKLKASMPWDVEKIKNINGVERVSAITGHYDLMIILNTRTIGRGYQPIVQQLEKLPFLDKIHSLTILKEWNA